MDEIVIQAGDVDDIRYVLNACLHFFQAQDLLDAQRALNNVRPSPLTQDIERVKARVDFYFNQWVVDRYENEVDEEDQESAEEAQEADEGLTGVSEDDVLSDTPLGSFEKPKQKGRRMKVAELAPEPEE